MKLLFDENLSRRLVGRLAELYPDSAHLADFDLLSRPDREIWNFAQREGFVIVTTDADFYELATTFGPPPKVAWLRRWSHATRDARTRAPARRRNSCPGETQYELRSSPLIQTLGILVLDRD